MTLRSDPTYTARRSYVVKLSRDATPHALCGQIENLVTGTRRNFNSAYELLDLIAVDIKAPEAGSPGWP